MDHGGTPVSWAEFEANLAAKMGDHAFQEEVRPLPAAGVDYDVGAAHEMVQGELLVGLPGDPWKGGDAGAA